MEILSVMNSVVTRLCEQNPEMDVSISSVDAHKYIPQTQQVTVIINYSGSLFAMSESSDALVQQQTLRLTATVIVGKKL